MKFISSRHRSRCVYWLLLAVGSHLFLAHPVAAGELMYAVSAVGTAKGTLLTLDVATGAVQVIGPAGMGIPSVQSTVAITARPSDGALFVDCNTPPAPD